jgi:hypothetical protein
MITTSHSVFPGIMALVSKLEDVYLDFEIKRFISHN